MGGPYRFIARVAFSQTCMDVGRWSHAGPASAEVRSVEGAKEIGSSGTGKSTYLESEREELHFSISMG